jgi:hypothetical protein
MMMAVVLLIGRTQLLLGLLLLLLVAAGMGRSLLLRACSNQVAAASFPYAGVWLVAAAGLAVRQQGMQQQLHQQRSSLAWG